MNKRAAIRLLLSVMSLVVVTAALPIVSNVWGAGSILLSAVGAPASASIAWTSANMISASIYVFAPVAAPVALFQIA